MRETEINLLTVPQAAERLGVTESAIRRWLLERRITSIKVGRRLVRIPASEIQRLVEAGLRPARLAR